MERVKSRRIGVLGGSFDPPHIGHLKIAERAQEYLALDKILFAPTRQPPHKPYRELTPIEDRLEMVRLAIAPFPQFAISRIDVDREGPTYTSDTMRLLREQLGTASEIYFIMGMDSLANILTWHRPEEMLRYCKLAVFKRPGFQADVEALERHLPGLSQALVFIPGPDLDVSASDLQRRIRFGESTNGLIPDAVAAFIREHALYQT